MHIRKLELQGFKSFPDRTTFHYGPGISGVVGPNGCGKSNVVDAVKWCLGEQSAKSLRGQAMQDIIFAGSETRNGVSMAEVSITFAASDEPFPGEYARYEELQVARRMFRTGQSEYTINQQRVRRKDILDLFLDSGAGNRLYSFIEQGRISEIVQARPEQRRTLIEEAAGISRFKARRDEADLRLRDTLLNLDRVNDVLDTMTARLRTLESQVERAMRFRRLKSRLKQAEIFLGLAQFAALSADRRALSEQLRDAEAAEASAIREVMRQEEALSQGRQALIVQEAAVGRTRDRMAELEALRRETESARQYQTREQHSLEARVIELGQREQAAELARVAAARRLEETEQQRQQAEVERDRLTEELEVRRARVRRAEDATRARRNEIETRKASVMQLVAKAARTQGQRTALAQRRRDRELRLEKVRQRRALAGTGLGEVERLIEAGLTHRGVAEADLLSAKAAADEAEQIASAARTVRDELRARLARTEQDREQAERDETRARARLESLEELQRSHAGVDAGVKGALSEPGVIGTLAEQLEVPEDLEAALAVALGPALNLVLVTDAEVATRLCASAMGRLGLLVVDRPAPTTGGVLARVGGSKAGLAALSYLFEGCMTANTVAEALASQRATSNPCLVLGDTPAFVSARGEIMVGRPAAASVLARRRELRELSQQCEVLVNAATAAKAARDAARAELARAGDHLTSARSRADAARSVARAAELAVSDAVRTLEGHRRELERREVAARDIAGEESELLGSIAADREASGRLEQELSELADQQGAIEDDLKQQQAFLAKDHDELGRARDALNALAAQNAGIHERLAGIQRTLGEVKASLGAAADQVGSCARDLAAARERIQVLIVDDARLAAEIEALSSEQAEIQARLAVEREVVKTERQRLQILEDRLRGLRVEKDKASAHRAQIDRRIGEVKDELARIREQLDQRYEVSVAGMLDRMDRLKQIMLDPDPAAIRDDLPEVARPTEKDLELLEPLLVTPALLADEDAVAAWARQHKRVRTELGSLGEVNLVAVREYTEVAQEHGGLASQRDDLDASVRAIRQTIARLNRTCRERFRDTFDRVNAHFEEIYPRLVGGGRASLKLTDEEDLLETGVDIVVQPPGKRLQNLSLLSGGETAMVAIALIFSLFRVKPSPFCLLDEVDAPLDEGNGARFNSMLREMSQMSQFIVITHNKKTMECADTLYGVTMPVPGVSRLVTVKLE